MANYARVARRAIYDRLSATFNSNLASVAATYGIENVPEIDWTPGGPGVFEGFLVPSDVTSISAIATKFGDRKLGLVLYVSASQDRRDVKFKSFSGVVTVNADFYWMALDGYGSTEDVADAIEDAVNACFRPPISSGAATGPTSMTVRRDPVAIENSGYMQRIPFEFSMGVLV